MRTEEKRLKDREYYIRNRERVLAQVKTAHETRKEKDPDYLAKKAAYHRAYRRKRADEGIAPLFNVRVNFYMARHRAKKKGIPFNLEWAELEAAWTGRCALTGIAFDMKPWKRDEHISLYSPSLDKIDPKLGYVRGNTRWVLNAINMFKNQGTDADIINIARELLKHSSTEAFA